MRLRLTVAFALIAAGLTVGGTTARAQPSRAPLMTPALAPEQPAGEVPEIKSPGTALALSLGGTVAAYALAGLGGASESGPLGAAGSLGIWLAPSLGHWYAGRGWTPGLKWRLGGAGAAVIGMMWFFTDCIGDGCNEDFHPGLFMMLGGGGAFVGGTIHDIATAPEAARQYNLRAAGRVQGLSVRPTVGAGRAGLALGGRF
jgi:hypothetical protein